MVRFLANPFRSSSGPDALTAPFSMDACARVRAFHRTLPGYAETPLVRLDALAASLDVASIAAKDESQRLGLKAFKALGASYAVMREIRRRFFPDKEALGFDELLLPEVRERIQDLTLVTATDGNHGKGVAWVAKNLGLACHVFMPHGTVNARADAIRDQGAQVTVIDENYDAAVALAEHKAAAHGWLLMQDTSRPEYIDIPLDIMRGYMTLADEACETLDQPPTHCFLQCGVGSLAAAVAAHLVERFGPASRCPHITVVEPHNAACFYESIKAGDGKPVVVGGALETIMAGLACGEPSPLAWDILRTHAHTFVSCPDEITTLGMRAYACPKPGDPPVTSGESGAVTLGLALHAMTDPNATDLRAALGLDHTSRILLLSTEGDTYPALYKEITACA